MTFLTTRIFRGAALSVASADSALLFPTVSPGQNLLNWPESVVYDTLYNRHLVSNRGSSSIVAIDSTGVARSYRSPSPQSSPFIQPTLNRTKLHSSTIVTESDTVSSPRGPFNVSIRWVDLFMAGIVLGSENLKRRGLLTAF